MELFYNPDVMPPSEVKQTFVARAWLVDELLAMLDAQPAGAGVQHVMLVAPRGMGKTTLLLMIEFAVRDGHAGTPWQVVRFNEESYSVTDLADFWLAIVSHLADEPANAELIAQSEALQQQYRASADLADAVLALLRDWSREHGRRILVLADNFDMILDQIGDERENARLRDVLMNDGTFMLIGTATTFFGQARSYQQPLYNFFKVFNLDALDSAQIDDLLTKRATVDARTGFAEVLRANAGRLRALEYFTGGNPRLVLMLYRIAAQAGAIEVRRGLEKLLDEVTPYFKAKIELLPPQQRKILDHIAKLSAETREGQTPKQIAQSTRLPANQVSAQLRRMLADGYVRTANLRGRESYYTLAEPLFAVWYQMRFGRQARERVRWLVDFLRVWYEESELEKEADRLGADFPQLVAAGKSDEARGQLAERHLLLQAVSNKTFVRQAWTALLRDCLAVKAEDFLSQELLPTADPAAVQLRDVFELRKAKRYEDALLLLDRYAVGPEGAADVSLVATLRSAILLALEKFEDALKESRRACARAREMQAHADGGDGSRWARALILALLNRLVVCTACGNPEDIREACRDFLTTTTALLPDSGEDHEMGLFLFSLTKTSYPIIRDVIKELGLEQRLFPLVRAIDYFTTGDEALLEKLSPEVRGVVDLVVAKLRSQAS